MATFNPTNSAELVSAIAACTFGDTIVLQAGTTYMSPALNGFIFGNKGVGSSFITVTTSNVGALPSKLAAYPTNYSFTDPSLYRITTAEAAQMPKLVATDGFAAPINFTHGAHHWKFVGVEVTNDTVFSGTLVGTSTAPETSPSHFAHDLWFERCFIHPQEETGDINVNFTNRSAEKGILFNGHNFTVRNCAIQGFVGRDLSDIVLLDTNAVMYVAGSGNVSIENCLLEGQSNNVWLGGGAPQLVPVEHTATMSSPTITSGVLSQSQNLVVGDLFGIFLQKINSRLVSNTNDPNGTALTPILSGWGVGKVLSKSGNTITFENITSAYDYRRFEIKFGTGVTGGTFTLTLHGETTGPISFSASRSTLSSNVRTALEALPSLAPADIEHVNGDVVYVAAPTYGTEVLFANSYRQTLPSEFTINASGLTGSGVVTGRLEPHWSEYYTRVHPSDAPNAGAATRWRGTVPDGFVVKRNIIAKHAPWLAALGVQKGFGQSKSGTNFLFEGNIFHGQPTGMIWEVKNQGGDSPWSTIKGVVMRSNIWSLNGSSIALAPVDGANRTTPGSDFLITNNLLMGPGPNLSGEETFFGNSTTGGSNVTVTHNTMLLSGRVCFAVSGGDGPESVGFTQLKNWVVKDNIIRQRGGFFVPIRLVTTPPYNNNNILDCWPDMQASNNVIFDDLGLGNPSGFFTIHPNNPHPTSVAAVGFTNAPGSLNHTGDYRLAVGSQFKGTASDGTDPGVNYDSLINALGFDPFTGGPVPPDPAPTVVSVSPTSGPTTGGTNISIAGTGFKSGATVQVGGVAATNVVFQNSASITARTAANTAGSKTVQVTNSDGQTGSKVNAFTYVAPIPAPTVTAVSPNSGPTAGGTSVTVVGTGFLAGATLRIGGVNATNVVVQSSTTLLGLTPPHAAGIVNVEVVNTDGQSGSLGNAFTYIAPPPPPPPPPPTWTLTVASSNPGSGVGVTVSPVDNTGQASGTTQFTRTYNDQTLVSLTAPTTAGGNDFQKWQRNGVDWATSAATSVVMNTSHTMTAVYQAPAPPPPPPQAFTLSVRSENPVAGVQITVAPNDNTGQGSGSTPFDRIYNSGTSLALTAPSSANGNPFSHWERDSLTFATTLSITPTLTESRTFTAVYVTLPPPPPPTPPAPTVTAVSPNKGTTLGGLTVIVSGTGFQAGASVTFGGTPATGVQVLSSTAIQCITPARAATGKVAVTVTNTDGKAGTLINAFQYQRPKQPRGRIGLSPNAGLIVL